VSAHRQAPSGFSGCGIAGVLRFDRAPRQVPGVACVRRVTDALAHRGPDGAGIWEGHAAVLGHRRLSIIGPGKAGAQPMTRDHLTITYNGEVYNYRALRTALGNDFTFTSATDTEVVLRAWQKWGPAALQRFDGMFAFALWDARAKALTLVRDRVGIKPLYTHRGNGFLVFASEAEALLRCKQVPRRPDLDAVSFILLRSTTLQPDRRQTALSGVESLPPATCLTVHADGTQRATTYWALPETPRNPPRPRLAEELADLLKAAVDSMLVADVGVGAFLSGGLDSSAINAVAASTTTTTITSLTVAYADDTAAAPDEERNDDLRYSRVLAHRYRPHLRHHVLAQPHQVTLDDIDAVCDLATPCDDARHVSMLRSHRTLRELDLGVVLNGQGADELMGGYISLPNFVEHAFDQRTPTVSRIARLPGSRQAPGLSQDVLARRDEALDEVLTHYQSLSGPPLERVHRLLFCTQLARIVQFEDFLSMRASVEARFPFLDHHLVEWCFAGPFEAHLGPAASQGKHLLREAMKGLLPPALLHRRKQVFPSPDKPSLRGALASLALTHDPELRADPLVCHLFDIPDRTRLAELPADHLWILLNVWRWHHKLSNQGHDAHSTARP